MTNFERIKQMSVEELSKFLFKIADCCFDCGDGYEHCEDCPLNKYSCSYSIGFQEFLKSEVETE